MRFVVASTGSIGLVSAGCFLFGGGGGGGAF